ncbi:hypothetical protein BUQ74_00860 [Leptospira weilii serovar Heyan]|nr:hypothetical protein BUQ74_00860 [Leptospira weilii serovar Heyan]
MPTDLSSDPSICGVGYVREQHFSFLFVQTFNRRTHVNLLKYWSSSFQDGPHTFLAVFGKYRFRNKFDVSFRIVFREKSNRIA